MTGSLLEPRVPLVIDTSAWHRQRDQAVYEMWEAAVGRDQLASCPAAALEILYSARDESEFAVMDRTLSALRQAPITASACQAAVGAARELKGNRRLPATDYLIAAAAAERGFGVLHDDSHFDLLATVLAFESVRLPK